MSRGGLQPERVSMKNNSDLSFRESVDVMFNRAVSLMDLSPGLEEKIRVCNATYTVRCSSTW
jgi:glutamate dehydrogenase (NAD(P)+)